MATRESNQAAPAASVTQVTTTSNQAVQARVFDLTGTSITMAEHTTHDRYTGPLAELLAVGLVRKDQFPPVGVDKISWLHGERMGRGRCSTDETYVRVWIGPKIASVGLGVPQAVQQARRRAQKARYESWRTEGRQAAQSVTYENAVQSLADVPKSEGAYLRSQAKTARIMMMVAAKSAADASAFHGYRIDSDSMEEIYTRIDAVIEAFLEAQVEFDPQRQAEVIAAHQRKIVDASPSVQAHVKALAKVNPSLLQGEAA